MSPKSVFNFFTFISLSVFLSGCFLPSAPYTRVGVYRDTEGKIVVEYLPCIHEVVIGVSVLVTNSAGERSEVWKISKGQKGVPSTTFVTGQVPQGWAVEINRLPVAGLKGQASWRIQSSRRRSVGVPVNLGELRSGEVYMENGSISREKFLKTQDDCLEYGEGEPPQPNR
jgi:hypothetical protein